MLYLYPIASRVLWILRTLRLISSNEYHGRDLEFTIRLSVLYQFILKYYFKGIIHTLLENGEEALVTIAIPPT